jgi:8-oxo-dGTP pyrophosphatase MutT (NUDIX family)
VTDIPQAGAICYKISGDAPMVLLVRAKRNPSHLIFPKGHIEPGEDSQTAAIRELKEEAGVDGKAIRMIGDRTYTRDGASYRVMYFLVRFGDVRNRGEALRDPAWYTIPEALALLSFSDARELLQKALPYLH